MTKLSPYLHVSPSGAVTVDLAAYMKTPAGQEQLRDIRRLEEFVRSQSDAGAKLT